MNIHVAANNLPAEAEAEVSRFLAGLAAKYDLRFIASGAGARRVFDFRPKVEPQQSGNVVAFPRAFAKPDSQWPMTAA